MQVQLPSRRLFQAIATMLLAVSAAPWLLAQSSSPVMRPAQPALHAGPHQNQEHLAQWMDRHRTLTLPEQQRALEVEPGFRELPPQVQQRMRERLTELNNMPPEKRQHLLDRAEAMEHLSPQQRQQVRGAMLQLSSLPEDRRRLVAHTFRTLRQTPSAQRAQLLASEPYRTQFSDQERSALSSLIAVEPFLPPPPPPNQRPPE